jgi:tetratricopeptide (TPR) repeat protein
MRCVRLLAFVGVLAPAIALAEPPDRQARLHFESGRSYYEQGRYDEALHEFEEAYRLASPASQPIMLFNVAQTQERIGRLSEAIDSFRRYLEASPRADDRAAIESRIQNLQSRLDATRIAITSSETGASVLVDGTAIGTTPLAESVRVTPGVHEIRVEKDGFHAFSLRVTVPVGEEVEAEANLVSEAEPDVAAPAAVPGPRVYTWVAAGIAGAALVGGTVLGLLALSSRDDANGLAHGERAAYDDARSSAESLALFSDVAFGVAAAAGVTAVVLFVIEPGWGESEVAIAPTALAGGSGLSLTGAF